MATSAIAQIMLIVVCLTMSLALSEFFRRIKLSRTIGQIMVGVLLSLPYIRDWLFIDQNTEMLGSLSEFGIIFLLLLTGMEININKLKAASKNAIIITLSTATLSFLAGFGIMMLLKYSVIEGVIVGMCLAIVDEGIMVRLLHEYNKLGSRIGNILIGSGLLDDILEVIFLSFLIILTHHGSTEAIMTFPLKIIAFLAFCFFAIKTLPMLMKGIIKERSEITDFTISIILGLFIAVISSQLGFGTILGALVGGLIIQNMITDKHEEHKIVKDLQLVSFGFIVPFFFIFIGLQLKPEVLLTSIPLVIMILGVAIGSKMIGALITKPTNNLSIKQLLFVGWGMNIRGGVGLVIAELARSNSIISQNVYSALVLLIILTTLIFPFIFNYYLNHYPGIMD